MGKGRTGVDVASQTQNAYEFYYPPSSTNMIKTKNTLEITI